jgi:hypothetical protein
MPVTPEDLLSNYPKVESFARTEKTTRVELPAVEITVRS